MAIGINQIGCRTQATRAVPFTSAKIGLCWPIGFATVQYFIEIPPWCLVFLNLQTYANHFTQRWKHFRADLERFREMCKSLSHSCSESFNWSHECLGFLRRSLWKVFLKSFLHVSPIPIRRNSYWASVHHAFSHRPALEENNFGLYFVGVPIFDPTPVQ